VALGRVEAVVGQERHPDQLPGPAPGWWRPRNGTRRPGPGDPDASSGVQPAVARAV